MKTKETLETMVLPTSLRKKQILIQPFRFQSVFSYLLLSICSPYSQSFFPSFLERVFLPLNLLSTQSLRTENSMLRWNDNFWIQLASEKLQIYFHRILDRRNRDIERWVRDAMNSFHFSIEFYFISDNTCSPYLKTWIAILLIILNS